MAIVVPVMLYEVVMRYLFNAPTVWGMELAVLLFGPYFLLGGPYLLHLKGHVALDLARQRLSAAWQRRLEPMQRRVADGCHLTRDPVALVRAAGFEVLRYESRFARGPKPWSYMTEGFAISA